MVFGAIAVAAPTFAGTAVVTLIGVVLLVSGVIEFVQGFREETWAHKLWSIVLGVITTLGGIFVLAHPLFGLKVLTLTLAIYFAVGGIWKIVASFSYRPAAGWPAVLVSGLISLILGVLIWRQWPASGLWAVGILVGADLLVTGCSMIIVAMTAKHHHGDLGAPAGA